MTVVINMRDGGVDEEKIRIAARFILRGELVAFPTETVYGLGADALNEKAVRKIFEAKKRPADNPLIIHIARLDDLERIAREVPPEARLLAERFWPGPLTSFCRRGGKTFRTSPPAASTRSRLECPPTR